MKKNNPGFSVFEIDSVTLIPQNLKYTFLDLEKTYGMTSIPNDLKELPLYHVNFKDLGLKDL